MKLKKKKEPNLQSKSLRMIEKCIPCLECEVY